MLTVSLVTIPKIDCIYGQAFEPGSAPACFKLRNVTRLVWADLAVLTITKLFPNDTYQFVYAQDFYGTDKNTSEMGMVYGGEANMTSPFIVMINYDSSEQMLGPFYQDHMVLVYRKNILDQANVLDLEELYPSSVIVLLLLNTLAIRLALFTKSLSNNSLDGRGMSPTRIFCWLFLYQQILWGTFRSNMIQYYNKDPYKSPKIKNLNDLRRLILRKQVKILTNTYTPIEEVETVLGGPEYRSVIEQKEFYDTIRLIDRSPEPYVLINVKSTLIDIFPEVCQCRFNVFDTKAAGQFFVSYIKMDNMDIPIIREDFRTVFRHEMDRGMRRTAKNYPCQCHFHPPIPPYLTLIQTRGVWITIFSLLVISGFLLMLELEIHCLQSM